MHLVKIRYLTNSQDELLREEARIRESLITIQSQIIPKMDIMQKRTTHAKTFMHDNNFSVAEHIMELSREVYIELHVFESVTRQLGNYLISNFENS